MQSQEPEMYKVTDEQVDFMLHEIRARGVLIEDLQWNLVDHMCCIVEHEMSETDDFYRFFERLLPRFFNDNLREIQEETENLLTFKHFYAMKKTVNIAGLLTVLLTVAGAILKVLHLPGAGISIVLGIAIFSLIFLPLMVILKFRDEVSATDKLVLSTGFVIGAVAAVGVLFKLMHWPTANILMISGISGLTFLYVPLYFFTRVRRPELRFNTIINSVLMMAAGGLLFSLMNLSSSDKIKQNDAKSQQLMAEQVNELKAISAVNTGNSKLDQQLLEVEVAIEELRITLLAAASGKSENSVKKVNQEDLFYQVKGEEPVAKLVKPSFFDRWDQLVQQVDAINREVTINQSIGFDEVDIRSSSFKSALMNLEAMTIYVQIVRQKNGEKPA